jgi:hypothetical protein
MIYSTIAMIEAIASPSAADESEGKADNGDKIIPNTRRERAIEICSPVIRGANSDLSSWTRCRSGLQHSSRK